MLRRKAAYAVDARLHILKGVADGVIGYRRKIKQGGRLTLEAYDPTPGDRIRAIELMAKMAGVAQGRDEEDARQINTEQVGEALASALRDPAVREWVLKNDPAFVSKLRLAAGMPVETELFGDDDAVT